MRKEGIVFFSIVYNKHDSATQLNEEFAKIEIGPTSDRRVLMLLLVNKPEKWFLVEN